MPATMAHYAKELKQAHQVDWGNTKTVTDYVYIVDFVNPD